MWFQVKKASKTVSLFHFIKATDRIYEIQYIQYTLICNICTYKGVYVSMNSLQKWTTINQTVLVLEPHLFTGFRDRLDSHRSLEVHSPDSLIHMKLFTLLTVLSTKGVCQMINLRNCFQKHCFMGLVFGSTLPRAEQKPLGWWLSLSQELTPEEQPSAFEEFSIPDPTAGAQAAACRECSAQTGVQGKGETTAARAEQSWTAPCAGPVLTTGGCETRQHSH